MFLEELEVRGIRNLRPQLVRFPKRVTVIFGTNGQGKTSFLEAIFLLAHNRSFRGAQLKEVLSHSERTGPSPEKIASSEKNGEGFIRGVIRTSLGTREIALTLTPGKRTVTLDGKKAESAAQFFGNLRCVTFTPEELQLVKGAPQVRRQYIDRTLSLVDPGYFFHLMQYQRALKQRNALLSGRDGEKVPLGPWNALLSEHGVPIAAARNNFINSISPLCGRSYGELCRRSGEIDAEEIEVSYRSHFLASGTVLSAADFEAILRESEAQDRRLRATQRGVHRDDLEIEFTHRSSTALLTGPARSLASQGQTRTAALALKLAAIEFMEQQTGDKPILLLDDVESELDPHRRAALFEFLERNENQVLITTTDPAWAPTHRSLDAAAMRIEAGRITPEERSRE